MKRQITPYPITRGMVPANRVAREREETANFKSFSAAQLYCPKCAKAMPVKEKLLLHIPGGDLFDYVCKVCGTSLGTRKTA